MSGVRQLLFSAGGLVLVTGSVAFLLGRRRKGPEDRERARREKLNTVGRLTDGTVLDVQEIAAPEGARQFLLYSYDVGGVEYECSQDVTDLRPYVNLHSCRLGLPASVKYDPHNPGNSIVASERWMGIRR